MGVGERDNLGKGTWGNRWLFKLHKFFKTFTGWLTLQGSPVVHDNENQLVQLTENRAHLSGWLKGSMSNSMETMDLTGEKGGSSLPGFHGRVFSSGVLMADQLVSSLSPRVPVNGQRNDVKKGRKRIRLKA